MNRHQSPAGVRGRGMVGEGVGWGVGGVGWGVGWG